VPADSGAVFDLDKLARFFGNSRFMKTTIRLFPTAIAFLCLIAAGPRAQAVVPAPDGGYPGGNTAEGQNALFSLTTGGYNTAIGFFSLRSDTAGSFNTAVGAGALFANTGDENTATGIGALLSNTGSFNTANGAFALVSNTTGNSNTAVGNGALQSNTTGFGNIAIGPTALFSNTTASGNTAIGAQALLSNVDHENNTAVGYFALSFNTGGENTGVGDGALGANTTGSNNTAIGTGAGGNLTTGNNNIDIGSGVQGVAGESNTIRIGNTDITDTFVKGISGSTVPNGVTVIVNGNGRLGTIVSSARFKDEIKPMDKSSEAILALKPVTFCYKKELDPDRTPQFGLVAEEVEKVNPNLVARDAKGEVYTVRYEAVNAMLLNEFLKEHRKVQKLEAALEAVDARLKEQDARIQSVSERIELSKPSPQIAINNQ
jgi:hypothetical protein